MTNKRHPSEPSAAFLKRENGRTDSNEISHRTTRQCEGRDLAQDAGFQAQTNVCNLVKSPLENSICSFKKKKQRQCMVVGPASGPEAELGPPRGKVYTAPRGESKGNPSPGKGLKGKERRGRGCRRSTEEGTDAAHKTHPGLPGLQLKIHIFWTKILIF